MGADGCFHRLFHGHHFTVIHHFPGHVFVHAARLVFLRAAAAGDHQYGDRSQCQTPYQLMLFHLSPLFVFPVIHIHAHAAVRGVGSIRSASGYAIFTVLDDCQIPWMLQ